MKNASCHDEKMEAYCNVVRSLEDKFYGIELNHAPCWYNEEADELTKIVSGRIIIPPNVFARDVAKLFVNLESAPSSQEEPSGAPSDPAGAEPIDEDPSNEAFVLSLLEGYGADEAEVMDTQPTPLAEDWRAKYHAWMDRGELPTDRSEARRTARMAKSFTLVDGELFKCAASGVLQRCIPIPQGRELLRDIHAGACGHHVVPHTLVGNVFCQCRMDLPGPTTSVGTRTDYLVGPWDYPACATRHLKRGAQGLQRRSTRLGSYTCPALYGRFLDVLD
jgi:hypothetical protein